MIINSGCIVLKFISKLCSVFIIDDKDVSGQVMQKWCQNVYNIRLCVYNFTNKKICQIIIVALSTLHTKHSVM